jgi:hypothetical protein
VRDVRKRVISLRCWSALQMRDANALIVSCVRDNVVTKSQTRNLFGNGRFPSKPWSILSSYSQPNREHWLTLIANANRSVVSSRFPTLWLYYPSTAGSKCPAWCRFLPPHSLGNVRGQGILSITVLGSKIKKRQSLVRRHRNDALHTLLSSPGLYAALHPVCTYVANETVHLCTCS